MNLFFYPYRILEPFMKFLFAAIVMFMPANIFGTTKYNQLKKQYSKVIKHFSIGEYQQVITEVEKMKNDILLDSNFGPYLNFYYALALYKENNFKDFEVLLYFIKQNWPLWRNIDKIYYWLGVLNFEKKNLYQGFEFFDKSLTLRSTNFKKILKAKLYYYKKYGETELLEKLYLTNKQNIRVAKTLLNHYKTLKIKNRNIDIIKSIHDNHNLYISKEYDYPEEGQIEYDIAIFLTTSPSSTEEYDALEFYKGLKLSIQNFAYDRNIKIKLHAFDVKKSFDIDKLFDEQIKHMDLIIGPLISDFKNDILENANKYNIFLLDPISKDLNEVKNEIHYLLFSSLQTKAREAAYFILNDLRRNTITSSNAIVGVIYTDETIEKDLAEIFEEIIHADKFKCEIISVYVPKKKLSMFLKYYMQMNKNLEPKEDCFFSDIRNLTHIYLPTTNEAVASTFLSALEINNVNAKIIVNDIWLSFESIIWESLKKNNFYFLTNSTYYTNNEVRVNFRKQFLENFDDIPNQSTETGYSMGIYLAQRLISKKLFSSIISSDIIELINPQGIYYGGAHDNQYLKIIKFTNVGLVQCD